MTSKCKKCRIYVLPCIVFLNILFVYFTYIINLCISIVPGIVETVLFISLFNILFIMVLWSFLSVLLTPVAVVPAQYKLSDEEMELLETSDDKNLILERISREKNLVLQTRYPANCIRVCVKCRIIKPDRAHHCSRCETCILKMDHHCPWLNNCIGFSNSKSFVLFLVYSILYCLYVVCTSMKYVRQIINLQEVQVIVTGYSVIFYGSMCAVVFMVHCTLLSRNTTSIDKLQQPIIIVENATYDLGCRRNLLEVFGKNWLLWPFPVFTALGTGYTFPLKVLNQNYSNV